MLKKINGHKLVSILCACALAFVLGGMVWFVAAVHGVTGPLILHFNDTAGVTQVGNLGVIFGIGFLAILMVVLNAAIALELAARDRFLGDFAAVTNLAFAVLLFIAAAAIISVN
jgi:hypothetical protein